MNRRAPRAGLLPLYLSLYDRSQPGLHEKFKPLYQGLASAIAAHGVEIRTAPVCRVADDMAGALADFSARGVDCIITLHLAYSPSLEAAPALARSGLPVILLSTSVDPAFGPGTAPARIMYNHGIHGVMDLANILRRRGVRYQVVSGHCHDPRLAARAADCARAARAALRLGNSRVLRVGPPFAGMGDFQVGEPEFKQLGVEVSAITPAHLEPFAARVAEDALRTELESDNSDFVCACPREAHARSLRSSLALRAMLTEGKFNAFSLNFLAFDTPGSPVPFLEASKAMARGFGYAGEGDALTAAMVGALASAWPLTTFTEIFCPDWKGDSLFLSHMGEVNPALAAGRPRLLVKDFPYTPAPDPAVLTCCLRAGEAMFLNLAPAPENGFELLAAPVTMLPEGENSTLRDTVRGWMRPSLPVPAFLEAYSRHGGTHHSALVMGLPLEAARAFAAFCGVKFKLIEHHREHGRGRG